MQQRSVYYHGVGGRGGPLGFFTGLGFGGFFTGFGLGGFFIGLGFGGGLGFCIPADGGAELDDESVTGLKPIKPKMIRIVTSLFIVSGIEDKSSKILDFQYL